MDTIRENLGLIVSGTLVVLLLVGIGYWMYRDEMQWEAYRQAHHCQVIRLETGSVSTGLDTNGKVVVLTNPDKTTWRCDDGIEYTR